MYLKDHGTESLATNHTCVIRHLNVQWKICHMGLYIHRISLERYTKKLAMVFVSKKLGEWRSKRVTYTLLNVYTFLYYSWPLNIMGLNCLGPYVAFSVNIHYSSTQSTAGPIFRCGTVDTKGPVQSYTRIFDCAEGWCPNLHVVQGSTVYDFIFFNHPCTHYPN